MDDSDEKQEASVAPGQAASTVKLLSGKQWFALAMVILGAVATGAINIGVREYYQPDVRYEEGTWYYSGGSGIISLRIKNYGATDAEQIVFTATFDEPLNNASVNEPSVDCRFDEQKNPKTITGRIERLVPGQTAIVYFSVGRNVVGTALREGPFVRSMVYKGGQGKPGDPRRSKELLVVIFSSALGAGLSVLMSSLWWSSRRRMQTLLERLTEYTREREEQLAMARARLHTDLEKARAEFLEQEKRKEEDRKRLRRDEPEQNE